MNKNYFLFLSYFQAIKYYYKQYRSILDQQKIYRSERKEKRETYTKNYERRLREARDNPHNPNHLKAITMLKNRIVKQRVYRNKVGIKIKDAERQKWQKIEKNYGLTKKDYYKKINDQNSECDLCKEDLPLYRTKEIHIDHCHTTGKVRGILHSKCNNLLGFANDDISKLELAIKYLKKYNEK